MSKQDYYAYLDSPEWWHLRKLALQRADYQCERCGSRECLEVHHRTYARLGAEYLSDLEVLCDTCHKAEHAARNRQKRMFELYGQTRLFPRWELPAAGEPRRLTMIKIAPPESQIKRRA